MHLHVDADEAFGATRRAHCSRLPNRHGHTLSKEKKKKKIPALIDMPDAGRRAERLAEPAVISPALGVRTQR